MPTWKRADGSKRTFGEMKLRPTTAPPIPVMPRAAAEISFKNSRRPTEGEAPSVTLAGPGDVFGESFMNANLLKSRIGVEFKDFKCFHRDGAGGTTLRAQAATDADGFVLNHDRPFAGKKIVKAQVL